MNLQKLGKIDKGWGFEIIFANNDKYCGKLLVFERVGAKTSLVFHKDKRKSWFVNSGKFKVKYIDVSTGELKEAILEEGKTADFAELGPHQIESLAPNSMIFEVGTADYIEDRFRLAPGDSQKPVSGQQ
jgi:hypothetical protein